ncbi:hypothetical protein KAR91_52950 [Candidatus Pacearchaeota archaeon]|nr:hypothetical protein [Candidatus Pacearchaeota archaeon]
MSDKRYIPRDPRGRSMESLASDLRSHAIRNIKEAYPSESFTHWKDLQEEGWKILDRSGPPQIDMF